MNSSAYCLCTVTTTKAIESLLEGTGAGTYKDEHPWIVAAEFFARAREAGQALPILFATGAPLRFSHWSIIERIDVVELRRGRWQTACDFGALQPVNPIWAELDALSLKAADEQMRREALEGVRTQRHALDEHCLRPYAICETPPFILAFDPHASISDAPPIAGAPPADGIPPDSS
jgi:hypothetical protein